MNWTAFIRPDLCFGHFFLLDGFSWHRWREPSCFLTQTLKQTLNNLFPGLTLARMETELRSNESHSPCWKNWTSFKLLWNNISVSTRTESKRKASLEIFFPVLLPPAVNTHIHVCISQKCVSLLHSVPSSICFTSLFTLPLTLNFGDASRSAQPACKPTTAACVYFTVTYCHRTFQANRTELKMSPCPAFKYF